MSKPKSTRRGRPQIPIDQKVFEGLCNLQCSRKEICGVLGISEDTLDRFVKKSYGKSATFTSVFSLKSAGSLVSLRRAMFKSAESGNVTAQIWLSKQHLGMRDVAAFKSPDLSQLSEESLKKLAEGADPSTVIEPPQDSPVVAAPLANDRVN